jgi:hypothetical protein
MLQRATIVAAAALVALVFGIAGATAQIMLRLEQLPLDAQRIERFLQAAPDLGTLANELKEELRDTENIADPAKLTAVLLRSGGAMSQLSQIAEKHGYDNLMEFLRTAYSIGAAYLFVGADGKRNTAATIDAALERVRNSDMPEEQKQALLRPLKARRAAVESIDPLPGNVEAVTPYRQRIEAIVGEHL